MFRHYNKTRTLSHSLKIASLLSFVAGCVNVAGFLAVQKLTTNVTGHFAFFVEQVFKLDFWQGFVFFLYILFFFMGSFVSNFIIELVSQKSDRYIYIIPASVECVILFLIGIFGNDFILKSPNMIAFGLLFAMGLQNSLVTTISNASIRTTHLTGLFTDLGIELSQLFFYQSIEQKSKLYASIQLRFTIIGSFFMGGVMGGVFYSSLQLKVLILAASFLVLGLVYDSIKYKIIQLKRRLTNN